MFHVPLFNLLFHYNPLLQCFHLLFFFYFHMSVSHLSYCTSIIWGNFFCSLRYNEPFPSSPRFPSSFQLMMIILKMSAKFSRSPAFPYHIHFQQSNSSKKNSYLGIMTTKFSLQSYFYYLIYSCKITRIYINFQCFFNLGLCWQ